MAEPVTSATQAKKSPTRSPSYPYVDLKEALEKAEVFRQKEGRNAAQREVGVVHWGYKSKSSGGKQTLGALRAFGLMEAEGPMKLTEDALRVLLDKREDSSERDALIRKMALLPPIHKRLWERYQTALPSDESLRHSLIFDEGFNENTVGEFIKEYKSTIKYARLADSGSMPPEGGEPAEDPPGGSAMETHTPPAPRVQNPSAPPAPGPVGGAGNLPPVTFPLPGDNALEIRLRSKMSRADFDRLKPILVALLEMSVVEAG